MLGVADGRKLDLDVGLQLGIVEGVAEGLLLGITDGEGLLLGVTEGLKLGLDVCLLLGIVEGVAEALLLGVAEGLKLKLGLKDGVGEGITEGEGEALLLGSAVSASAFPLSLSVPVTVAATELPVMRAISISSEWAVKSRLALPLLGTAECVSIRRGTLLCIGEGA